MNAQQHKEQVTWLFYQNAYRIDHFNFLWENAGLTYKYKDFEEEPLVIPIMEALIVELGLNKDKYDRYFGGL